MRREETEGKKKARRTDGREGRREGRKKERKKAGGRADRHEMQRTAWSAFLGLFAFPGQLDGAGHGRDYLSSLSIYCTYYLFLYFSLWALPTSLECAGLFFRLRAQRDGMRARETIGRARAGPDERGAGAE